MDVAASILGMKQTLKNNEMGALFMKQEQRDSQNLVDMLQQSAASAPKAPGTGMVVDKSA